MFQILWLLWIGLWGARIPSTFAQSFPILDIRIRPDGRAVVTVSADADHYYLLYRGEVVTDIRRIVDVGVQAQSTVQLTDPEPLPLSESRFFRVEQAAVSAPRDTDNDGMDDILELRNGTNPLRADATTLTTFSSSPAHGESGVSVTRETILRFSNPLAPNTVPGADMVRAEVSGRPLLSRIELSQDRRTLTLFYLEPMPGSIRVRVQMDGNRVRDAFGQPIDANLDGTPGGLGVIEFDTLSQTAFLNTIVCGRVFASELAERKAGDTQLSVNVPLKGVIITADGLEETVRAITDEFGNFKLTNAPAGPFFVHIDGRPVVDEDKGIRYPDRAYYPYVGKQWESLPGREVNIGEVYLPLVADETLKPVSATEETVVTFPQSVVAEHPELAGVSLTVPPNALFADDGKRGGSVGIAPVPPDRLPGPLPPGLDFPLVITVQTDGAQNFAQPVPACFPNLPDPVTGVPLNPGDRSALWSFNHDTGQFEIVGPMTVSADGRFVCTDPGVGILAPGWHGSGPGSGGGGGPGGPGPDSCGNGCCGDCCGGPETPAVRCCDGGGGAGGGSSGGSSGGSGPSNPVHHVSGEKHESALDLRIPGVGFDIVWQRTYRSKDGIRTPIGNNWDFSYNLQIFKKGNTLEFCDGSSRLYTYQKTADGDYVRAGEARVLRTNEQGSGTMVLGDGRTLQFHPFDGSIIEGKILRMSDRNGNAMGFAYDAQGRLARITDTLDRNIVIAYNNQGFIESVTDFTGRSVRYTYYQDGEPGGSFGDLKSVTTPPIVGTPNGNDFPNGKTTTYTYSKGFADDRLNHNLLTITDGRRNDPNDPTFGSTPYLVNIYGPTTDPNDPRFDRVIRQIRGGDPVDFTYLPQEPTPENDFVYTKTIIRDRVGNVHEYHFKVSNQLVLERVYTGRSDINQPVTPTSNRPRNKLRPNDPDYFETRYEYNGEFQKSRVIHPNGNVTEYVYESDLDPLAPPRKRNNLRVVRHLPGSHLPAGDQSVIEETYAYDGEFGCGTCGFNFVTKHVDGRGNAVLSAFDERGNLIARTNRLSSVVDNWEYDGRGRKIKHIHPDNGSGHRQVDQYTYYENGPMRGYLKEEIADATGFALKTTYEYDSVGNVVRRTDPKGFATQYVVNALNQIVRETSPEVLPGSGIRYVRDYHYDANNNLVRTEIENRRELILDNGVPFQSDVGRSLGFPSADGGIVATNPTWTTRYEYEILNNLVRKFEEVEPDRFITTEYQYDGNRNLTLTRFGEATAGRQPNNAVAIVYDERDLQFRQVRAPGDPQQSSTQFDYDGNGNRIRVQEGIEDDPHETVYQFDGFNREVSMIDAMGNVTTNQYDPAGNRVLNLVLGELNDGPGSQNNVRLSETHLAYDALNRLTNQAVAFFNATNQVAIDDGWATTQTLYTDRSLVFAVINDNGHGRTNRFDTVNRLRQIIDAKGNTITYDYDANGNALQMTELEKSDLAGQPLTPFPGTGPNGSVIPYIPQPAQLGLDETFLTHYEYDQHNRLIATIDGVGNVNRSGYDSRSNRTRTVDALTNVVQITFDGLSRELDTIREMVDRVGVPPLKPTITTRQAWDDSSRLITQTDDNGNPTTYLHDPLSRKFATVFADGTGQTNWFDAHGSAILFTDANGNWVTNRYDDLDRLVRRDVKVGPGVSDDTTWEDYRYDGLSRLTYAADDDSVVIRNFDSLGHVRQDIQGTNVVGADYDSLGNQREVSVPDGRKVLTSYDELGRKERISVWHALHRERIVAKYWYVGPSRITRREYGNRTTSHWQYNGIHTLSNSSGDYGVKRITRTSHIRTHDELVLDDRMYKWDPLMNKLFQKGIQIQAADISQEVDYGYDSALRLIRSVLWSSRGSTAEASYEMDGVGNRLSIVSGSRVEKYTLRTAPPGRTGHGMNQYAAALHKALNYDNNGNLTESAVDNASKTIFYFDFQNRLVGSSNTANQAVCRFSYDAIGRRFASNRSLIRDESRTSIYSAWQEVVVSEASNASTLLIWGQYLDEILNSDVSEHSEYYYTDDLYNVVLACDGGEGINARAEYNAFGQPVFYLQGRTLSPYAPFANIAAFTGRRLDETTGIYDYRTRPYDSSVGRFMVRDTIGGWVDVDSLGNALTYARNNPLRWVDPYGTCSQGATVISGKFKGGASYDGFMEHGCTGKCDQPYHKAPQIQFDAPGPDNQNFGIGVVGFGISDALEVHVSSSSQSCGKDCPGNRGAKMDVEVTLMWTTTSTIDVVGQGPSVTKVKGRKKHKVTIECCAGY